MIDWSVEDLERVRSTSLKRYNAEIHAQSAVEAVIELVSVSGASPHAVRRIEIDVFDVAYHIIGGGEEGDKTLVRTKEQADHSLPYMVAVAALDGRVMPEQYAPERIARRDVQELLRRVVVRSDPSLSKRFPREHPCRVRVELDDGRVLVEEKSGYLGFHTRPMSWDEARSKFDALAAASVGPEQRAEIAAAVADLDDLGADALCELLSQGGARRHEARARPPEV